MVFNNTVIALINVRTEGIALIQYDLGRKQFSRLASKLFSDEPNQEEKAFRAYVRVSYDFSEFRCEVDADRYEIVE